MAADDAPAAGKKRPAAGTLADASKQSLEILLNRKKQKKRQRAAVETAPLGICGAPSRVNADEPEAEAEDDDANEWVDVAGGGLQEEEEGAAEVEDDEPESGELHIRIEEPNEEEAPQKQRRKSVR